MFEIKLIFYSLSRMLQIIQFVSPLSYSVWDVFNNFLLIDATDRSKISSDQKRFFYRTKPIPPFIFREHVFKEDIVVFISIYLSIYVKLKKFPLLSLLVQITFKRQTTIAINKFSARKTFQFSGIRKMSTGWFCESNIFVI